MAERAARTPRVFGARYAALYDALYAHKDYPGECRYLERLFCRHAARPIRDVLSLGCGTGNHDLLLAQCGFRLTGVDRSTAMLARYREKFRSNDLMPEAHRGDIRAVRLDRQFDAVIAMFAVFGYMVSDADLAAALTTAATHLRRGGLLVFDAWNGLAILGDPPHTNRREMAVGDERLVRCASCRTDWLRQVTQIRFITERWRGRRRVDRVIETHPMRHFFPRELGLALVAAGFELAAILPFGKVTGQPSATDWTIAVVARRAG